MKYLNKHLMNELREKYFLLMNIKSSESIAKCRKLISKGIKKRAQINSYGIENYDTKVPFSVSRNNHKKRIKKGIQNIENAFCWGVQNFNPYDFDESFIRELAGRITPELYNGEIAKYRDTGVNITGASVTPPYPYKLINYELPQFIDSFKKQLECKDVVNRIETSIFAHLHLARLHPFVDGNGRTARTFQDIILNHYEIPIPIIESGERYIYSQCLDKAVLDWDEKKALRICNGASEGEQLFYNLIAGKINSSLNKLVN